MTEQRPPQADQIRQQYGGLVVIAVLFLGIYAWASGQAMFEVLAGLLLSSRWTLPGISLVVGLTWYVSKHWTRSETRSGERRSQ